MKNVKKVIVFLFVFIFLISVTPNFLMADQTSDVSAFVFRFYNLCLGRTPEAAGLSWWANELISGRKTGAEVANGFVFSQEFLSRNVSNADYVTIMYKAFFNRPPDPSGYSAWMNDLNAGRSRQYVLAGFINSQEFKNLCASFGINPGSLGTGSSAPVQPATQQPTASTASVEQIGAFVTRFYQLCLNRPPDPSGLNNWVNLLASKRNTGAEVAYGFVFSQEFLSRNVSNADFVTIMYKAFFNRPPDPSGYNNWMNDLSAGRSRQYVFAGFVNSTEFRNLCAGYGITPGSITVREQSIPTAIQPEGNIRNIVVLGDSQVADPRKWPEYLAGIMKQNYPQYEFRLYKSGVGGEIIPQGINRVSSLYPYRPSIYIINYGTNDANGPYVGSYRVAPATFGSYLGQMIDRIRSDTGAIVVVMSTAPSYDREQSHPMGNLANMNNEARRVAQLKGAVYVDVFNSMINTGNYSPYLSDGLHYSDLGSQFAAQVALNAISTQFR
jgi:lysophospholipase L1-like esterase